MKICTKKHEHVKLFTNIEPQSTNGPLYRQIKARILQLITSNDFLPGQVFLSEVELAATTGVTRATVRQATNELVAEGVLIREKGKRPRVGRPKTIAHFLELAGVSKYVDHGHGTYTCQVLQSENERADAEIAKLLRIRRGDAVFVLERLRSDGDIVFGWEKTWMNKKLLNGIENHDFSKESLYHILKHGYHIVPSSAEGVIDVLIADSAIAKTFKIREGTPMVSVHRTVCSLNDEPIQVNHEIYRGDCYSFAFKVSKNE